MKKYIIFFVTWFICIFAGFFLFFVDRSSLGFVSIVNLWVKSSCIYSVLIGYVVAFCVVIGLYLKDKLKHIKIEDKTEKKEELEDIKLSTQNVSANQMENVVEENGEKAVFS